MSNFVTIETDENKIKLKNLFFVAIFVGFTWIVFHFTIVFFFGLVLESILLVGLFLGIGNIIAMLIDIPIGVLQKYIKPKSFLLIASSLMFLVSLIFLKFIYFKGISGILPGGSSDIAKTISYLGEFLNSGFNIFLLIFSACLYGLIKESFDVTILSYIFNNSSPSEYASFISKYNIHFGIGSMIGLIFSGILLALNIKIAIVIFTIIILLFVLFIGKYFDNSKETIEFEKIKKLKLDVLKNDLLKKKDELISNVSPSTIIELSKKTKIILLKPIEIKKSIDFKELYDTSLVGFKVFYKIIFGVPKNVLILWFMIVILHYGFWDTFVSTFQVEFLEKIIGINKEDFLIKQTAGLITGYVLLGLVVIPAFALQDFFINLSKKVGVYKVIIFGIFISTVSLFFFGVFTNLYMVVLFGFLNSTGYAATMPLAQAIFSGMYNDDYAKKFNLKEIDATASAAPLKIVLNFANVIGLIIGAILVSILGFDIFFEVFSFVLLGLLIYSLINMKKFSGAKFSGESLDINTKDNNIKQKEKSIDSDFV